MDPHHPEKTTDTAIQYAELVECVWEMMEAWTHFILYTRDVYPRQVFKQSRKYGVPVQMCMHPDVVHYIRSCLKALIGPLKEQRVKHIAICLFTSGQCQERYVIEFIPTKNRSHNINNNGILTRIEELEALKQQMRSVVLSLCSNRVPSNKLSASEEATFTMQASLISDTDTQPLCEDAEFPWMHCAADSTTWASSSNSSSPPRISLLPVAHVVLSQQLKLQMYIENYNGDCVS